MYDELAAWWPLLSSPGDYAEEAEFFRRTLAAACDGPVRRTLELGSGGGNNASHLKAHMEMVLVDPSAGTTWDPDDADVTYLVDYAFMLRETDGTVRAEHDRHVEGLFARAEWLRVLRDAGFEPQVAPFEHSEVEPGSHEVFVARRPRP